jgi:hypothetical protein
MKPRGTFLISVLLACALGIAPAWGADFVLYSQNLLRFGQGSKNPTKCQAMTTEAATADIMVIQELMTSAYPTVFPCAVPPGFSYLSFGPLGSSSYKEFYGFLWRSTQSGTHPLVQYTNNCRQASNAGCTNLPNNDYVRPPTALLFTVQTSSKNFAIWIGDIHSVYGKTVTPRRLEATEAGTFFQSLRNAVISGVTTPTGGWPTIIAGDWNLPVRNSAGTLDSGFDWLTTQRASGEPAAIATSLTKNGAAASSPYDHIIYNWVTSGHGITLSNVQLNPVSYVSWPDWRRDVSDHLGVQAEVTVQ